METIKKWGFLVVAWLSLCLILLFAACSTLQNAGPEQASYRVTVTLPPGSLESEFVAALNDSHPLHVDFKPYTNGYDDSRRLTGSRIVIVTFTDEPATQNFRQQLQQVGVPLQLIQIQKVVE